MVFEGVESVHIGTKQAATDMVHGLFVDGDDIVYLNKVRIRKGLEFIPGIFEDDGSVECEDDELPRRYTNRWESPGSPSIAINPLDLELVTSTLFLAKDLLALPSIYNVETSQTATPVGA
jgi:hypothetical protein